MPSETALAIVLASVRKDGLLVLAQSELVILLSPIQLLTAVYLGGVLVPCLVTVLTIAREQSLRFALLLALRQALAAIGFALILARSEYFFR